jgi:hypothetical protein
MAVLPAMTPESATDFLALGVGADEGSLIRLF